MTEVFQLCPAPPDFELDWGAVNDAFAWVRAMRGCPQDAVHHAEGDVWVHTRMVCESLAASAAWRGLPEGERAVVFAAALMHDIGKPACTREEGGRVTSRGHSPRGAILARESLWRMDAPVRAREQVAALVRWHQVPFFLLEREDGRRRLFEVSQTARADLLALVAEADARGRVGEGQGRLVDNVALFAGYAEEEGCLSGPKQFPSDHSRFLYFRKADRDPDYHAFDDTVCEVIVMSGLPGAGKDHWIRTRGPDWPVVSLDALRREMRVAPTDNQGPVVARAREAARAHLRRRQPFIWNATNVSREMRAHCLSLCAAYNARVRVVYVEASERALFEQNRSREQRVPAAVINRLLARWEVPDLTEAHAVEWVINS